VGLLSLAFLAAAAPAALGQENTTSPTPTQSPTVSPTPPPSADLPRGGKTTVSVDRKERRTNRSGPEPDRPPGSGDSTDGVSGEVPSPSPGPHTECEPFEYRQAYRGWGPAAAFGRKVSVLYDAEHCVRTENGILRISMDGTAEIRQGNSGGKVISKRRFELEGTWVHPSVTSGWPPDWWACGVTDLDYEWRIQGRYSFEVEADDGKWTLDVSTVRRDRTRTVHWTFDAC
jgi:hypothetical protein